MNSLTALLTASGPKLNSSATRRACSANAMLRAVSLLILLLKVPDEGARCEGRGQTGGSLWRGRGGSRGETAEWAASQLSFVVVRRRSSCGRRGARNCKTSTSTTNRALRTWWVDNEKLAESARTASCRGLGLLPRRPAVGLPAAEGCMRMGWELSVRMAGGVSRRLVGPMPARCCAVLLSSPQGCPAALSTSLNRRSRMRTRYPEVTCLITLKGPSPSATRMAMQTTRLACFADRTSRDLHPPESRQTASSGILRRRLTAPGRPLRCHVPCTNNASRQSFVDRCWRANPVSPQRFS